MKLKKRRALFSAPLQDATNGRISSGTTHESLPNVSRTGSVPAGRAPDTKPVARPPLSEEAARGESRTPGCTVGNAANAEHTGFPRVRPPEPRCRSVRVRRSRSPVPSAFGRSFDSRLAGFEVRVRARRARPRRSGERGHHTIGTELQEDSRPHCNDHRCYYCETIPPPAVSTEQTSTPAHIYRSGAAIQIRCRRYRAEPGPPSTAAPRHGTSARPTQTQRQAMARGGRESWTWDAL